MTDDDFGPDRDDPKTRKYAHGTLVKVEIPRDDLPPVLRYGRVVSGARGVHLVNVLTDTGDAAGFPREHVTPVDEPFMV